MLTDSRKKMDDINKQLLDLLIQRLDVAKEIGEIKVEKGIPIYDVDREADIMKCILTKTPDMYKDAIAIIFSTILSESRKLQMRTE